MNTFELVTNQRTRKTTPVVRVNDEDHVIFRKIYTESITKKKSGLSHLNIIKVMYYFKNYVRM